MKNSIKIMFALFTISMLIMLNTPKSSCVGIGVNPAELNYIIISENTVSQGIWVINTGDVRTRYDLFFDSQYQSMFTFSNNGFALDPENNEKVDVYYSLSQNPEKNDLNINLYVKGTAVGSNIETGIKIPIIVTHQLGTTTTTSTTTISGHYFPLNPYDPEILRAIGYLSSLQDSNGGVGGFSTSCWATMAIASSGYNPNDWRKNDNSILDYLINNRNQIDENKVTDIAKFILALTAANENPRDIEGVDYVSMLEGKIENGQYGDELMYNDDFWAIIALISAGIDPNASAIQNSASFIKSHQNHDGGWSWTNGESDVDNTAAAIIALIASGENRDSPWITSAVNYLKSQLHPNGGFTFIGDANSASNSWAIMALMASDMNPTDPEWVKKGISPVDHLLSLQNSDGSFSWKQGEAGSAWWTAYAIPALLGKPYPITEEATLQYTTTTTAHSQSTTSIDRTGQVYVRIEDLTTTIWRGWLEIPESVDIKCYNSGNEYNIQGDNVLAILDEAAEMEGFTYQVSDQYYPDLGFYVDSIGGHDAEGEYGWMYRVNYILGDVSIDNYQVGSSDNIMIYWGTQNARPLRIEVDRFEVDIGEPFTVTLKYRDDSNGEWIPLAGATLHVNDDYITDTEGKATITLHEEKVYNIYAEKWGESSEKQFIRSDIVQVGVGVPIPEFPTPLPLIIILILTAFYISYLKNKGINR